MDHSIVGFLQQINFDNYSCRGESKYSFISIYQYYIEEDLFNVRFKSPKELLRYKIHIGGKDCNPVRQTRLLRLSIQHTFLWIYIVFYILFESQCSLLCFIVESFMYAVFFFCHLFHFNFLI